MDKGDYVIILSFMAFLGFLSFLTISRMGSSSVIAPSYVQVPPSLGGRGNG